MAYLIAYRRFWDRLPAENRTLCGRVKRLAIRASHQDCIEYSSKAAAVHAAQMFRCTVMRETQRGEHWDYELLINFENKDG